MAFHVKSAGFPHHFPLSFINNGVLYWSKLYTSLQSGQFFFNISEIWIYSKGCHAYMEILMPIYTHKILPQCIVPCSNLAWLGMFLHVIPLYLYRDLGKHTQLFLTTIKTVTNKAVLRNCYTKCPKWEWWKMCTFWTAQNNLKQPSQDAARKGKKWLGNHGVTKDYL